MTTDEASGSLLDRRTAKTIGEFPRLYHYTCLDHGDSGIWRDGAVRPNRHPMLAPEAPPLVWLTPRSRIWRPEAVGLQSVTLTCDRTAVRYEIEPHDGVWTWSEWADLHPDLIPEGVRETLEAYAEPTWLWLSVRPVRFTERRLMRRPTSRRIGA